jgi:hypothetical protein
VLQAELPPRLLPPRLMLLLPPPLPACAVWSCTQCCWEGVGGLKELRICSSTGHHNNLSVLTPLHHHSCRSVSMIAPAHPAEKKWAGLGSTRYLQCTP